jgi:hypothetical protein
MFLNYNKEFIYIRGQELEVVDKWQSEIVQQANIGRKIVARFVRCTQKQQDPKFDRPLSKAKISKFLLENFHILNNDKLYQRLLII